MRFRTFINIFLEDYKYNPTKDEIRHFNQVRKGGKVDYSKDVLNQVIKNLSKISIQIRDEKVRNKFAEVIYKNMGSLEQLVKAIKSLNSIALNNSKRDEIETYINKIEEENF